MNNYRPPCLRGGEAMTSIGGPDFAIKLNIIINSNICLALFNDLHFYV